MYGCESWTIKRAECQRSDAFQLGAEKTLESPLDCKEIQPVHPKGGQSWVFIGRTDAEAETPILWPPDTKNWLFATPWAVTPQASLSITNSQTLLKLMSIEWVMPSSHLILCRPLLLPPSTFPSIRVFSNEGSSHQMAKVLELQLQHHSFQWIFRNDFL